MYFNFVIGFVSLIFLYILPPFSMKFNKGLYLNAVIDSDVEDNDHEIV